MGHAPCLPTTNRPGEVSGPTLTLQGTGWPFHPVGEGRVAGEDPDQPVAYPDREGRDPHLRHVAAGQFVRDGDQPAIPAIDPAAPRRSRRPPSGPCPARARRPDAGRSADPLGSPGHAREAAPARRAPGAVVCGGAALERGRERCFQGRVAGGTSDRREARHPRSPIGGGCRGEDREFPRHVPATPSQWGCMPASDDACEEAAACPGAHATPGRR